MTLHLLLVLALCQVKLSVLKKKLILFETFPLVFGENGACGFVVAQVRWSLHV